MNKTITLLKCGFVSSCYKTGGFKSFCRTFKSEFKKVLGELGCTDLECSYGHLYISGFFSAPDGRLWYFNIGDVRWMGELKLLVRTALHRKDYTGGVNMYAWLDGLSDNLKRIIGKAA